MQQGEIKLYSAVMIQAAFDIADLSRASDPTYGHGTGVRNLRRGQFSAMRWVADSADYPFSFRNCCQVLGIEPRRARQRLMRLAGLALPARQASLSVPKGGLA